MPQLTLPLLSIALDTFGLIVVMIIFLSCLPECSHEKKSNYSFMWILIFTIITLLADIVSWVGEGRPQFHNLTLIAATIASCTCFLAILFFLNYLRISLYPSNKPVIFIFAILATICLGSIILQIGNIFYGYFSYVDSAGHFVYSDKLMGGAAYLAFPVLSFFATLIAPPLAKGTARITRFSFLLYVLFPTVGALIDFFIHGLSMSYVCFVISVLLIYTGIYNQKQEQITEQQNALMLSQINPHFMYNTLSTIAAMTDIEPSRAKELTLEFSQYLRRNLTTLTCRDLIPFAEEMGHVECYLKIEKARFRESVNVIYSIQCDDFYVPPLSIQPIVENAVRHGITRKLGGGTVRISTYSAKKHYIIEIRDDGVGFDTNAKPNDNRKHVGFENVENRIRRMCHGQLVVRSVIGVGTRVAIIIPHKYAHPKKED